MIDAVGIVFLFPSTAFDALCVIADVNATEDGNVVNGIKYTTAAQMGRQLTFLFTFRGCPVPTRIIIRVSGVSSPSTSRFLSGVQIDWVLQNF